MKHTLSFLSLLLILVMLFCGCSETYPDNSSLSTNEVKTTATTSSFGVTQSSSTTKANQTPSANLPSSTNSSTTITTTATDEFPVISTSFNQEDFHTDILMRIDKTTYAVDDVVNVEIENKTDGDISFGCNYVVIQKDKNDDWMLMYDKNGTPNILYKMKSGGTHKKSVKLAGYDLQVGQDYKLVLRIGKKWVGADFSTVG